MTGPAGCEARLQRVWQDPPGFFGWFTHVNHRSIGRRYLVTAMVFFALGGIRERVCRVATRPEFIRHQHVRAAESQCSVRR